MYLGYATQRNTISVLIIVNKQFEKMGQNIGIGEKLILFFCSLVTGFFFFKMSFHIGYQAESSWTRQ
jgi:hypothetical protein